MLFDLTTKLIAKRSLGASNVRIIKYLLEFEYVENTGVAFSMLSGKKILILLISLATIAVIIYFFTKINLKKKKLYSTFIIFLLAGSLGNLIDRLSFGYVIDFISFPFISAFLNKIKIGGFICNIADLYLTAGIIIAFVYLIMQSINERKNKSTLINKKENNNLPENDDILKENNSINEK